MKLPGIFELTKAEQRTVVLIVLALVAAAMIKHYREPEITSAAANPGPPVLEEAELEEEE